MISSDLPPVMILNSSIITAYGVYEYVEVTLDEARALVRRPEGAMSAVGHDSTAHALSQLLGMVIPVNRIAIEQQVGQIALVFKPNGRLPEATVLTAAEIEAVGYSFGKLTRLS